MSSSKTYKLSFVFLLVVFSLSFVSSAAYPAPFTQDGLMTDLTVPSPSNTVTQTPKITDWSSNEICDLMSGCSQGMCYPFGYIRNETYCGDYYDDFNGRQKYEGSKFQDQKLLTENCTYDFECISNFCLNGKCKENFNEVIVPLQLELNRLKSILEEQRESTELIDENQENTSSTEQQKETPKKISFFQKWFSWGKN